MDSILPQPTTTGKFYVYFLLYPESMGGYVFYIGKGHGDRIDGHEREAGRDTNIDNTYKCRIIRKIWATGEKIVKTKVAYFEKERDALDYEIALIFSMRPYGHLTNLTDGGDGVSGYVYSAEQRRRMGENNRRRTQTPETRRKIGEAGKGRVHSLEQRRHSSEIRKGIPFSAEHCRALSESWRNRKEQALLKMREPISASGDGEWKNGLISLTLWEELS